jgi:hypothetical protein
MGGDALFDRIELLQIRPTNEQTKVTTGTDAVTGASAVEGRK